MFKNKWRHPIQYWRDMRRVKELFKRMDNAHKACEKAAKIPDDEHFREQATIFDACSAEILRLYRKWGIY